MDSPELSVWDTGEGRMPERLVWSKPMPLPDHLKDHDVRAVVTQLADGTLVNDPENGDQPRVFYGAEDHSPADARLVAAALHAAADMADRWASAEPTTAVLW
jgi:hypothetical protein